MGQEDGQKNLSKYCRQPCPLSGDFPEAIASSTRGSCRRGVLLSGSTSRSLSRGSARSAGRADRSSVNRSISQADPQGISSVPSVAGATVCPFFLGFLSSLFTPVKKGIYIGRRKNSLVSYSISIVSLLNWFFFLRSRRSTAKKKKRRKSALPARDDLSIASLSVAISAIIQVSKLARREISQVSVITCANNS